MDSICYFCYFVLICIIINDVCYVKGPYNKSNKFKTTWEQYSWMNYLLYKFAMLPGYCKLAKLAIQIITTNKCNYDLSIVALIILLFLSF